MSIDANDLTTFTRVWHQRTLLFFTVNYQPPFLLVFVAILRMTTAGAAWMGLEARSFNQQLSTFRLGSGKSAPRFASSICHLCTPYQEILPPHPAVTRGKSKKTNEYGDYNLFLHVRE